MRALPLPQLLGTSSLARCQSFVSILLYFGNAAANHCAAVELYVMHYNFCRVHEALRVTPAMQLGVTDHIWTISELVEKSLTGVVTDQPQGRKVGRFTVIDGGK